VLGWVVVSSAPPHDGEVCRAAERNAEETEKSNGEGGKLVVIHADAVVILLLRLLPPNILIITTTTIHDDDDYHHNHHHRSVCTHEYSSTARIFVVEYK